MGTRSDLKAAGEVIRQIRRAKGIHTRTLADQVQISYQHMANIENGHKRASIEVLNRIAIALEVPVDEISTAEPTGIPA